MDKAIFINNNVTSTVYAKDIENRKEYLDKYNGQLFCAEPGCTARVSFAETPTFRVKKMFKTIKHSEHSLLCPHRIVYDEKKETAYCFRGS